MTLLDHHRPSGQPGASRIEVLFPEARRRERQRRLLVLLALVLAAGATTLGLTVGSSSSGPSRNAAPVASIPRGLSVDAKAFRNLGLLAFISQGNLWVLDGAKQTTHKLPYDGGYSVGEPMFSPDGRWLAYPATDARNSSDPTHALWIAHADGTDAHKVMGLSDPVAFGWSPHGDLLGVTSDTEVHPNNAQLPGQYVTDVDLVAPSGASRRLVTEHPVGRQPLLVESATWSPDGREVAVSTRALGWPSGNTIRVGIATYPVAGGAPATWFSVGVNDNLAGTCQGCQGGGTIAHFAGWWPKWGIVFWSIWSGAGAHEDGNQLEVVAAPGAPPRTIGQTLSDGITDAVSAGPGGLLAIVSSGSAGRVYGQGKTVETCRAATLSCVAVPGGSTWSSRPYPICPSGETCNPVPPLGAPGSGESLDPNWSPDGTSLAYVKSPVTSMGSPPLAWFSAHTLNIWSATTGTSHEIAKVGGVSVPTWSRDGRNLLYVSGDALWAMPARGGAAVKIVQPLFSPSQWRGVQDEGGVAPISFYGAVAWNGQFAWWSPR